MTNLLKTAVLALTLSNGSYANDIVGGVVSVADGNAITVLEASGKRRPGASWCPLLADCGH